MTNWKNRSAKIAEEMEVMKNLQHKNIVKLQEVINDPNSTEIYLVMEYFQKGTLRKLITESERGLPEELARKLFRDLVQALFYIHDCKGLAHRDIKPENMMISD